MSDALKKFVKRSKADRLRYISLLPDDGWSWCEGLPAGEDCRIEYVRREDLIAALAERDALKAEVERLREVAEAKMAEEKTRRAALKGGAE
jgi:hypothetical protein